MNLKYGVDWIFLVIWQDNNCCKETSFFTRDDNDIIHLIKEHSEHDGFKIAVARINPDKIGDILH